MQKEKITKLTLAGMFAAMAFICFAYLRIEIPMGLGLTGKVYIGHTFIILSAILLGAKFGALTGAVGLSLADILAGYVTSAPPTFLAKFILGAATAFFARQFFAVRQRDTAGWEVTAVLLAGIAGSLINVITEPLIRYVFKYYLLGYDQHIAYVSAMNCAVSMLVSAVPSVAVATLLYRVLKPVFRGKLAWIQ